LANCFEHLVQWYLRLNGYFLVGDFVVHDPMGEPSGARSRGPIEEATDVDILAVRLPNAQEQVLGQALPLDESLIDESCHERIDCLIAEVKGEAEGDLNRVWHPDANKAARSQRAIETVVRRLGVVPEAEVGGVAERLREAYVVESGPWRIRLWYFCYGTRDKGFDGSPRVRERGVPQANLRQMAEFFRQRTGCWVQMGIGERSHHPQWDPFISELWRVVDLSRNVDEATGALKRMVKAGNCAGPTLPEGWSGKSRRG
jgi:hypothetical protein